MSVSKLPSIFLARDKWRTWIIIIHCPAPLGIHQSQIRSESYILKNNDRGQKQLGKLNID